MKSFRFITLILLVFSTACKKETKIDGLWELHYADLDMIPKSFDPTYLQINSDGTFSASQKSGDVLGVYSQEESEIKFSSTDKNWFNKSWKIKTSNNELLLWDIKNEFRAEQLRFRGINRFPSFEKFAKAISGSWQLYKKEEKSSKFVVKDTFVTINDSTYSIIEKDSVVESGNVLLDARHQKILFENSSSIWEVRLVWDELRISDYKNELTYRLRKY